MDPITAICVYGFYGLIGAALWDADSKPSTHHEHHTAHLRNGTKRCRFVVNSTGYYQYWPDGAKRRFDSCEEYWAMRETYTNTGWKFFHPITRV